jgi:hypothetical protein
VCGVACLNGGVCVAPDTCACAAGFGGAGCAAEHSASCAPACRNGGLCRLGSGGPECVCTEPQREGASAWSGPTCEVPGCGQTCLNGGACTSLDTCTCAAGWQGAACGAEAAVWAGDDGGSNGGDGEDPDGDGASLLDLLTSEELELVGAAAGLGLAVLCLCCAVCLCRRSNRRERENEKLKRRAQVARARQSIYEDKQRAALAAQQARTAHLAGPARGAQQAVSVGRSYPQPGAPHGGRPTGGARQFY